jgi:hypothetical protein
VQSGKFSGTMPFTHQDPPLIVILFLSVGLCRKVEVHGKKEGYAKLSPIQNIFFKTQQSFNF